MAIKTTKAKPVKPNAPKAKTKIPAPGRKMSKEEARDYVFTTFREAMEMLAKH